MTKTFLCCYYANDVSHKTKHIWQYKCPLNMKTKKKYMQIEKQMGNTETNKCDETSVFIWCFVEFLQYLKTGVELKCK